MASSPEDIRNICAQLCKNTHWFSEILQNTKYIRTEEVSLGSVMWSTWYFLSFTGRGDCPRDWK